MDFDDSLSATGVEEFFGEPYGLEDLERARMQDGCAVPVERAGQGVDEMARHTASLKLGSEQQSSRSGTYDEHCRLGG
jgi:hypothetical protein